MSSWKFKVKMQFSRVISNEAQEEQVRDDPHMKKGKGINKYKAHDSNACETPVALNGGPIIELSSIQLFYTFSLNTFFFSSSLRLFYFSKIGFGFKLFCIRFNSGKDERENTGYIFKSKRKNWMNDFKRETISYSKLGQIKKKKNPTAGISYFLFFRCDEWMGIRAFWVFSEKKLKTKRAVEGCLESFHLASRFVIFGPLATANSGFILLESKTVPVLFGLNIRGTHGKAHKGWNFSKEWKLNSRNKFFCN